MTIKFDNPAALAALMKGDAENAVIAATPGGIQAQERAGQVLLTSGFDRLPKSFGYRGEFPREILERLGFKIGPDIDDLFVSVKSPTGWALRPTEHSMHSEIVDDQGRVRGGVFYKAAFYDRKANFTLRTRYQTDVEYKETTTGEWEDGYRRAVAKDNATGDILLAADWLKNGSDEWMKSEPDEMLCLAILDERFPDWRNVEAYW